MSPSAPLAKLLLSTNPGDLPALLVTLGWSERDPQLLLITDEKSIKIEHVRALQSLLIASGEGKRILIFPAERITLAAQQALLKLIEEPPAGAAVVLAARSASALLPTLRSRLNTVRVAPVTTRNQAATNLWQQLAQAKDRRARLQLIQALPTKREELVAALTAALAEPMNDHQEVPWRTTAINVIATLKQNVTPGLCLIALAEQWWVPTID